MKCRGCLGTGKEYGDYKPCPDCYGTGVVTGRDAQQQMGWPATDAEKNAGNDEHEHVCLDCGNVTVCTVQFCSRAREATCGECANAGRVA